MDRRQYELFHSVIFSKHKSKVSSAFFLDKGTLSKRPSFSPLNIYSFGQTLLYVVNFIFLHNYFQQCDKWQHDMEVEI